MKIWISEKRCLLLTDRRKVLDFERKIRHLEQEVISNEGTRYDACSSNPYAEPRMFGDFTEAKKMVDKLLVT
ncbi:hypothetical protein Aduo_000693 [Ancylostoma duodenale]